MKIQHFAILAVLGLIFGLGFVYYLHIKEPPRQPYRPPAQKPYKNTIAGVGIVESYNENINVAPYLPGKISHVFVKEGDKVVKGTPLYKLDTSQLQARLKTIIAQSQSAKTTIDKLNNEPRKENIPPIIAQLESAKANYQNVKAQLDKLQNVSDPRAISKDNIDKKSFELKAAKADVERAQAELNRLNAGAWKYDVDQAVSEHKTLLASANEIKVSIAQSTIPAPINGEILKVNIHPGEYVSQASLDPPVLIGTTNQLQIRVDIDEINASNIKPGMPAIAVLKGDPSKKFKLRFVRIQPYMVPKKDLTGTSIERVDVRVLQIIYKFDPPPFPVYVGQQVDVFIDNKPVKKEK